MNDALHNAKHEYPNLTPATALALIRHAENQRDTLNGLHKNDPREVVRLRKEVRRLNKALKAKGVSTDPPS